MSVWHTGQGRRSHTLLNRLYLVTKVHAAITALQKAAKTVPCTALATIQHSKNAKNGVYSESPRRNFWTTSRRQKTAWNCERFSFWSHCCQRDWNNPLLWHPLEAHVATWDGFGVNDARINRFLLFCAFRINIYRMMNWIVAGFFALPGFFHNDDGGGRLGLQLSPSSKQKRKKFPSLELS